MTLPEFSEDGVGRLGSVLHSFLIDGLGLLIHPSVLKLSGPGHVQGGGGGADALAVHVTEQSDGVGGEARLWDGWMKSFIGLQRTDPGRCGTFQTDLHI